MRITALISALMVLGGPAMALELNQVKDPADIMVDYPYEVIGLAPGASYAEIEAVASERGIPLYQQEGVYTVGSQADGVGLDLAYGFHTHGQETPHRRKHEAGWEFMNGYLTTGATGNVSSEISRSIGIEPAEAPKFEAVLAQLTEKYGEPSLVEEDSLGKAMIWAHDVDGKKFEAGELSELPQDCKGNGGFTFVEAEEIASGCSVVFKVSYQRSAANTLVRTTLVDHALRNTDRIEASKQINKALEGDGEASKLDL